jgi:hypothetical protein
METNTIGLRTDTSRSSGERAQNITALAERIL